MSCKVTQSSSGKRSVHNLREKYEHSFFRKLFGPKPTEEHPAWPAFALTPSTARVQFNERMQCLQIYKVKGRMSQKLFLLYVFNSIRGMISYLFFPVFRI